MRVVQNPYIIFSAIKIVSGKNDETKYREMFRGSKSLTEGKNYFQIDVAREDMVQSLWEVL